MVKSKQPYLRSENGKHEIADTLHSKYNDQLQCPVCDPEGESRGAFNKDSGGTPDEIGRLNRRFKCRARPRCPKSLGVTALLDVCQKFSSTTSIDKLATLVSSGMFPSVCSHYYCETYIAFETTIVTIVLDIYLLYPNIV